MNLPLTLPLPARDKYIDEEIPEFKHWFVFGVHPNGNVDLYDGDRDIFQNIPKDKAADLILARDQFINQIFRIARREP